jgi:hypothetical protein
VVQPWNDYARSEEIIGKLGGYFLRALSAACEENLLEGLDRENLMVEIAWLVGLGVGQGERA